MKAKKGVPANARDTQAGSTPLINQYPFQIYGGPVIQNPQLQVLYVGNVKPDRKAYLEGFFKNIIGSDWMNIFSQYGVGKGSLVPSVDVPDTASSFQNQDLQELVKSHGSSPANCYALVIAENVGVIDGASILCMPSGDNAFGYHDYFWHGITLHPYSVLPAETDACLKASCANDGTCSLRLAMPELARPTQVAAHELAEMFTDPRLDAWMAGTTGYEIGDIWNGYGKKILVGKTEYQVQAMYSLTDAEKAGSIMALESASWADPVMPDLRGNYGGFSFDFGKLEQFFYAGYRIVKDGATI